MLLELTEHLFPIRVGDLGVHFGVLDIAMAQVIGYILGAASGFQEMDRYRMAQRMDGSAGDARSLKIHIPSDLVVTS